MWWKHPEGTYKSFCTEKTKILTECKETQSKIRRFIILWHNSHAEDLISCTFGGVNVLCIYPYARSQIPQVIQVYVAMWHLSSAINSLHLLNEDVPLVEFMYLVFTCMPGECYFRWLRSLLLYLCYIFWVLINSLVCWAFICWSNNSQK